MLESAFFFTDIISEGMFSRYLDAKALLNASWLSLIAEKSGLADLLGTLILRRTVAMIMA